MMLYKLYLIVWLMDIFNKLFGSEKKVLLVKGGKRLEIIQRGLERTMKFNDVVYSKLNSNTVYTKEYWDFFIPSAYVFDNPKILMIGLGGGTIPFQLNKLLGDKISLDIVEVDREMVDATKKFIPEELKLNIIIDDGAKYVHETSKKYDVIMLDAYESSMIPKQFLGTGFIEDASSMLKEEGLLLINYLNSSNGIDVLNDYARRLNKKFRTYKVNTYFYSSNSIIVCSKSLDKNEIVRRIGKNMHRDFENGFIIDGYTEMYEFIPILK